MMLLRSTLGLTAACVLLAGCDIPTDVPILEQRWQIPVEETTLGVAELLPSGVSVVGSNFSVSVDPIGAGETLGTLCTTCVSSGGVPVPVPSFNGTFTSSTGLPADVVGAVIASGSMQIQVENGFSFDPLAGGGTLTITLIDGPGGSPLGEVVIDGDAESLPSGATLTKTLTIGPGTVATSIVASAVVVSPGGEVAPINIGDRISVTATTESLLVSSATVNVSGTSVDFDAVDVDVEDLDADVTDRVQGGAITLAVTNPFGVAVTGVIVVGPVSKNFSLSAAPSSTVTLTYTGDELRSFLGKPGIQFSGSGTISGGAVTVTPAQEMTLDATLDITLQIG